MQSVKMGSLEIALSKVGDKTLISWTGRSDEPNPGQFLTPCLDSLVQDLKGCKVIVDFMKLEYMNSSTVPPIIHFVKKLDKSGITTTVRYDANSKWQTSLFKVLRSLSVMMTHITVKGKRTSQAFQTSGPLLRGDNE